MNDMTFNDIMTWHDQEKELLSWTYCGRFKILHTYNTFSLFRIHPETQYHGFIATFKDIATAKIIATIIKINEC
ncbi:MAG: hypothetical protein ABFD15_06045 [Methanofastidiosum sp.]